MMIRRILAFAFASFVLAAASPGIGQAIETNPSPKLTPAHPPRVLLIGLDGADLRTFDRLRAEGRKLSNLSALVDGGTSMPSSAFEPVLSPPLWTTIATGRSPIDHGIWDFLEIGPGGDPIPATSASRRVRALWNVAAENDVSVALLGWYATWPAERIRGAVVSDRMVSHQVSSDAPIPDRATFPSDLAAKLEPLRPSLAESFEAVSRRFVIGSALGDARQRLEALAKSHQSTELLRRSFPLIVERFRPELAAIYFDLPDAAGHLFADEAISDAPNAKGSPLADVWPRAWEYVDEVVGEILNQAGRGTTVILVSDHGFRDGDDRPRVSGRVDTGMAGLWHRRDGLFVLRGPGIRSGLRLQSSVHIEDVFPTVATVLRLPISKECPGRVVTEAFVKAPLPRFVDSYERTPRGVIPIPVSPDGGRETVARLKALGYLGGSESVTRGRGGRTPRSFLNEGAHLLSLGRTESAASRFREALALDSTIHDASLFLSTALASIGDLDDAAKALDAIPAGKESHGVALARGNLALERGRLASARDFAAAARTIDDRAPGLWLLEARISLADRRPGLALEAADRALQLADQPATLRGAERARAESLAQLGRRDEAVRNLRASLASAPSAEIARALGQILSGGGDASGAVLAFEQAISLEPTSPWSYLALGELNLARQRFVDAETQYRLALDRSRGTKPRELSHLGLALAALGQGKPAAARARLERGVVDCPASSELRFQLGTLFARDRAWGAAERELREAVRLDGSARNLTSLAAVFAGSGQPAAALDAAKRALALDPENAQLRGFVRALETGR